MERNELCVYFQPKIDLRTGRTKGVAALVRWMHPLRGIVPPIEFMPFAERTAFVRTVHALHTLGRLHALGVRLSIDDFGTGFSSLAYLRKLRVHEIKVDRTFIAAMEDGDDMVIVRSTIELAHNLGLHVVAEGIEDERGLARLRAMGCDEAQGFFMSRPLPEDKLLEWLRASPYGVSSANERSPPLKRSRRPWQPDAELVVVARRLGGMGCASGC